MKLYEINEQLERLLMLPGGDAVDTESGEIFSEEAVAKLEMEREGKVEGCLLFYKNQIAEAKALEEESKKLKARADVCKNAAERAKRYVQAVLDGEKFKTTKVSVSYRTTTSVQVDVDPEELPDEYKKVETTAKKIELKNAIEKEGKVIKGVTLVENKSMTIK